MVHCSIKKFQETQEAAIQRWKISGWSRKEKMICGHINDCRQDPNVENLAWIPECLYRLCNKPQNVSRKCKVTVLGKSITTKSSVYEVKVLHHRDILLLTAVQELLPFG